MDYRIFNAVASWETYSLLRTDQYSDSFGYMKILSTLDANSGYWQTKQYESDHEKTPITSNYGLYK